MHNNTSFIHSETQNNKQTNKQTQTHTSSFTNAQIRMEGFNIREITFLRLINKYITFSQVLEK